MAKYLIIRVEQYASDAAYPYLEQQQQILSNVVEQVKEDFPLASGESFVFRSRPNCGAEYIGVSLSGEAPTDAQLDYLRGIQVYGYTSEPFHCCAAYEVIPEALFNERKREKYYYWGHDQSQEIALQPVEA